MLKLYINLFLSYFLVLILFSCSTLYSVFHDFHFCHVFHLIDLHLRPISFRISFMSLFSSFLSASFLSTFFSHPLCNQCFYVASPVYLLHLFHFSPALLYHIFLPSFSICRFFPDSPLMLYYTTNDL